MAQAAHARELGPVSGGMRSFLPYSVAATLAVLAFPSSILFSLLLLTEPNPPVLLCSVISIALSSLASVIGARLWQKHPRSNEISFGDLMIWSYWTRRRAEARLKRGTSALGLDRRGTPVGDQSLNRADQIRVLHDLNEALESKDPYTRGHSRRVERHVFRMANTMGLSVHDIEDLRLAASLHDVGKIRVPDHILRKPGELTHQEYRVMQDHPSVGAWMLSYVGNQDVIEAVRYHHERWDGRGYPDGVAGTDIPLFARMIAVADTFDAITSTRPYRAKAARDDGLKELKKAAGSQLDPMCVEAFTSSLPDPVPVAALLFLLPFGIKKLVREFGVVARRAGVQTIATGVGAASAAVIVTTPVVAPSLGAPPRVERSVESGSESATQPLAYDGDSSTLVSDDGSQADNDDAGNELENDDSGEPGNNAARLAPVTEDPIAAIVGDDGTTTDTGETTTDGGSTDAGSGGSSGSDPSDGSGDGGGDQSDDGGSGSDERSNNGNPGASAGQQGSDNGNKDKDKDKGKDKDEGDEGPSGDPADPGDPDPPADPGNGNGNGGSSGDNGNSGGNGNGGDNGNGPPNDPGNSGGNGNSDDAGNGNSDGDKEKDKDKDKGGGEDPGTTGPE